MADKDSYIPDASFSSLVLTLSSSAWVGLGKIADPLSGETKKDLKSAKFTIDTLIMLREKTKGNLSDDETKLLQTVLGDLQANYAEVVFAGKESNEKHPAASAEISGGIDSEGKTDTGEKAQKSSDTDHGKTGKKSDDVTKASKRNEETPK